MKFLKKKRIKFLTVLLLLLLIPSLSLIFPLASCDSPVPVIKSNLNKTLVVPDNFTSIQEAVDFAEPGDIIIVKNKSTPYKENIHIGKPLTLIGYNFPVIENGGYGDTIKIERVNNVRIAGFLINGAYAGSGIHIRYGSNVTLENNVITNHEYGIYIYDSTKIKLRNNSMIQNKFNFGVWGLSLSHFLHDIDSSNTVDHKRIYYLINKHDERIPLDAGYVAVINCSRIKISNLTLSRNVSGVLLAYTTNSSIFNVTCTFNRRGIYLILSSYSIIMYNKIINNSFAGISLVSSDRNCIVGNIIRSNNIGISLSYSSLVANRSIYNKIFCNNLSENMFGIFLEKSENNEIYGNYISNNNYGISVKNSSKNIFCHNSFLKNSQHVIVDDSPNFWNLSYPIGGNYWDNYFSSDNNADGIIDSPYLINNNNKDYNPLIGVTFSEIVNVSPKIELIELLSNSTISKITFNMDGYPHILFVSEGNVSGKYLFRVTLPKSILKNPSDLKIIVKNNSRRVFTMSNCTMLEDQTNFYIIFLSYFSEGSLYHIEIINEFPDIFSLSLIFIVLICSHFYYAIQKRKFK